MKASLRAHQRAEGPPGHRLRAVLRPGALVPGLEGTKASAAFWPDPGEAEARSRRRSCRDLGLLQEEALDLRTTSSVRLAVAPGGSCMLAIT
jgi:hypothetical protein